MFSALSGVFILGDKWRTKYMERPGTHTLGILDPVQVVLINEMPLYFLWGPGWLGLVYNSSLW